MTKVGLYKLYPNSCVYTRRLNGIESELSFFTVNSQDIRALVCDAVSNPSAFTSLRGGTTWQSSEAKNQSSVISDFSTSHCDKGMYSKLGVPTRRSREPKTKFCSKPIGKFILLRPARRKVGQVLNEALKVTFKREQWHACMNIVERSDFKAFNLFVSFFVSRQKMKIKGVACDSQKLIIHPHLRLHTPLLGGAGGGVPALRHCEEVRHGNLAKRKNK